MECHFDFNKKTISKTVGEFLCDNLPNEAEHIKRIIAGKKLQYMEANQVLRSIMAALAASNVHDTEEIVIGTQDDDGTKVEPKPIGHTGTEAPILPGEVNNMDLPAKSVKFDPSNVCHYFATNKCRFGKDCRKDHPKMCTKFKKFGLAKFHKAGCKVIYLSILIVYSDS